MEWIVNRVEYIAVGMNVLILAAVVYRGEPAKIMYWSGAVLIAGAIAWMKG